MHPNDKLSAINRAIIAAGLMLESYENKFPVGTPVMVGEQRSQVITAPRYMAGEIRVLCANIGRWVPISELKKIEG